MKEMHKKKVLTVFGARPEAIKMVLLVKELVLFEIVPEYHLNIMKSGQGLYNVTTRILMGIREVLQSFKPDIVLVHGDTSTMFAAALAAFYERIAVGHVEAGLRTADLSSLRVEEKTKLAGVIF